MRNSFEHIERIQWPVYKEKNAARTIEYESNLRLFLESCGVGDIILVQRSSDIRKVGPLLLKATGSRYTHGMIVSSLHPVMVMHATYTKEDGTSGMEQIDLETYIRQYSSMQIIKYRIDHADELAEVVAKDIFPKHRFHRFSAFFETMIGINLTSKHRWNCVEVISDALINVLKDDDILCFKLSRTSLPEKLLYQLQTNVKRKSLYHVCLRQ